MKSLNQLFYQVSIILLATSVFSVKTLGKETLPISVSLDCHFNSIYFDKDEFEINPDYYPELYHLSRYMKENPHYYIKLVAHTDSRNTEEFNIELSRKRCKAVIDFMNAAYQLNSSQFVMDLIGDKDPMIKGISDEQEDSLSNLLAKVHNRIEFECYYK